jgi:uncharacterized protein YjbI with pentapeptide repeats
VLKRGREGANAAVVRASVEELVETDRRRQRPGRLVLSLLLLVIVAGVALWLVPILQVEPARAQLESETQLAPADRLVLQNQLFASENSARSTLAIILGAAGLLLAAGIIWRRFEKSRELKTHEQFARAVEQLGSERSDGSPRTEMRLGGIYELERLGIESEREYWPVMEVLTAYVRDNAAWNSISIGRERRAAGLVIGAPPRLSADIQAVLAVLGRRRPPHSAESEKRLLDLRETDLRGANLSGSRFDGVTMFGAHLEQADATRAVLSRSNLREASLVGASLTDADLEGASLARANLEGARLNRANLQRADLSGANLRGADLWEANLKGCNLKDADLRGADLSACVLEEAILWRADLQDAVLTGTRLHETHLERANLAGVTGLTWEQGEDAYTDENTILPTYLVPAVARADAPPATPTPAARRSPAPRASRPAAPLPAPPAPPAVLESEPQAEPEPAPTTVDNVVQLNAPTRKRRPRSAPKPEGDEEKPKKAALPKRRKPGLVKPA